MKAGKRKLSTFKALNIMKEEAHIYTRAHGAHLRSQSKKKQTKSTENLKTQKLSRGWFSPQRNRERQVKGSFETLGK